MPSERKFRIGDLLNTWMPALNLLRAKGYLLYISPGRREEERGDFWAIKDGRDFCAETPLALFGLIAIWEAYGDGDNWREQKYHDIDDELGTIAFPDDAYSELTDEQVAEAIRYWTPFFEANDLPIPKDRHELFGLFTTERETEK